jgi:GT2 family glycosyltransferase
MISIVIPSWNGCHLLKTLIPSLMEQLVDNTSVTVVDNGSTDSTVKWLTNTWPQINVITLNENRGFSGAVNAGIKAAGRDDIILVNNDTFVEKGWLNALASARERYPDAHIFASQILNADPPHPIDTAGDGFTIAGFGYKIGWLEKDTSEYDRAREVFSASGCSVFIRREVFDTIGMFDEDFFAFGEDLDFCFRARLAGFCVMYIPESRIFHVVRATAENDSALFWYHRNLVWLLIKNLPGTLFLLYWPHIAANFLLIGFRSIYSGWCRIFTRSLTVAMRGLPAMLEKRKQIQRDRMVSLANLRHQLDMNWVGVHLKLYQSHKRYKALMSRD